MAKMPKPMSMTCVMGDLTSDKGKHKFWKEDAEKVCDDERDIAGQIAIVTGSNTGIGKEAALQLAKRGAVVVMGVRTVEKGNEAMEEIKTAVGKDAKIEVMRIDVSDLQSVRDFVKEFEGKYPHLNILVNNAGVMDVSKVLKKTKDGYEHHIGTNHLGPFLLTNLLLESLKRGAPSRIVCVQSFVIALGTFDLDDLTATPTTIRTEDMGSGQYYSSKLFNAICMVKLAKSLEGTGIKLFQLDPGFVKTNMSAGVTNDVNWFMAQVGKIGRAMMAITPHQSAETIVYLCVAKSVAEPETSGKGEMYRFTKPWKDGDKFLSGYDVMDETNALYKRSREFVGLD